jgi:tetratricopeptide (TPR) repeat protein
MSAQTIHSPAFQLELREQSHQSLERALALAPSTAHTSKVADTQSQLVQIWNKKAADYSAANRFTEAAHAYGKSITIDPQQTTIMVNYAIVLFNLALTERSEARAEEAEILLRKAIAADDGEKPFYYLGLVQEATGRKSEAILSWQQAVKLRPDSGQAAQAQAKLGAAVKSEL